MCIHVCLSQTLLFLTARATWTLHNAWHIITIQQMFDWGQWMKDSAARPSTKAAGIQGSFNTKTINGLLKTYPRLCSLVL